jgi:hypothetical protein
MDGEDSIERLSSVRFSHNLAPVTRNLPQPRELATPLISLIGNHIVQKSAFGAHIIDFLLIACTFQGKLVLSNESLGECPAVMEVGEP